MRKWKSCLLLAAGMAAALSTAAMASQDKSDMVTVEVKECKGGAVDAAYDVYDENGRIQYTVTLPIGEKVQIPRGTKLEISVDSIDYGYETYDPYVTSYPKNLHVIQNGADDIEEPEYEGDGIWTDREINENCEIYADFVVILDAEGVGEDWDSIPNEDRPYSISTKPVYYDRPSEVNIELTAKKGTKQVPITEVPELQINSRFLNSNSDLGWYQDNFEITSTGIKSNGVIPLGRYRIPITYKSREENIIPRSGWINLYVGKRAYAEAALAEYVDDDGETYTIGGTGIGVSNPDADPDADVKQSNFFDAAKTKVSDVMKLFDQESFDSIFNSMIAGYSHNGEFVDANGKKIDRNDSRTLSEAVGKRSASYAVTPVLKNGTKTFKPVKIQLIPESQMIVRYSDSWVERSGKLYYYVNAYDDEGEWTGNKLANSEWVERGRKDVYCDSTGALVTDGIAGKSMNEGGLWLVDKKGYKRKDYSGTYTVGMNQYTIKNGEVTGIEIMKVEAPSGVTSVELFTDGLELVVNGDTATDEQKTDFADKLVTGMNNLTTAQQNTLHDDVIVKADEALKAVYNVKPEVKCEVADDVDSDNQVSEISAKGLLAAAGLTSKNADSVELRITQQVAQTASNAIMKFDAKLYVGDEDTPTQLKSPVIMEIELPEDIQKAYTKYGYTYKLVHTGENGKDIVKDGRSKNGLSMELSSDMKTVKIRTSSFSTFELQATRGEDTSIDDTTVTPSKPSNGNNSGNNSYSDSDDSDDSGTQSTTYRRKKTDASGQWVQDAKGWWYRRADGSWPKSQWIELGWNGVNSWYYFNESGYMVTGWREDGGYTYYLNSVSDGTRGQMLTGWHQIDSIWYYFNKLTGGPQGSLVKNATTPDGYKVGADGAWLQ